MPRMEHVGNNCWEKFCSRCNRLYKIEANSWDDAYNAFRKFFSMASISSGTFDGLTSWCSGCKNTNKARREDDIHREDTLQAQDNKCGICCIEISFDNRTANIDHDHNTGLNRKILCRLCNVWMAAIDNDEWLTKAIAYRDLFRERKGPTSTIKRDA